MILVRVGAGKNTKSAMEHKVKGFKFAGIHSGIKENPNKLDLALIYSEVPCQIAGTFTTNRAKAAPVLLDLKKIKKGLAQAVVVNSGNANACTGSLGLKNAQIMIDEAARALKISSGLVFVSSTGKIGVQLPIEKIRRGIQRAATLLDYENLDQAARAILTTDHFNKIHAVKGRLGKTKYTLIGFAKGAGMIEPAMAPASKHATMLAYFVTDLNISSQVLQPILNRVVETTFNRISVDGDMSTNDTALVLANGLAGNSLIKSGSRAAKDFEKNLEKIARFLALKMLEDGEGGTKVVEIFVKGARSEKEARLIAYRVARSELVKTSFYGQDPNWGRLLAAVGYSGAIFNPSKIDIYYSSIKVASSGVGTGPQSEKKAQAIMKHPTFTVTLDLKQGRNSFKVWTSDLTIDYVKLNAAYRT
jgi:glutamate N-acetyltransferase/amino-acid N-acetyltransferase